MTETIAAVLEFWFGAPGSAGHGQARAEWFRKDAAFDTHIAGRFGALIDAALAGRCDGWRVTPPGALALIIVLDQFTRNVLRDTPRAFAGDAAAQALTRHLLDCGGDALLLPVQRAFVYLPFEHAEDLALQDEAVQRFDALAAVAPELDGMRDYAHRHRAVIARFGRFPHRNAILGRPSTPQELEFLREPGSRF
jgi:uncharacterized protein (DUF924 family)